MKATLRLSYVMVREYRYGHDDMLARLAHYDIRGIEDSRLMSVHTIVTALRR